MGDLLAGPCPICENDGTLSQVDGSYEWRCRFGHSLEGVLARAQGMATEMRIDPRPPGRTQGFASLLLLTVPESARKTHETTHH